MATTTQTYGNLTAEQKTFYDRTLLSRLLPNLTFLKYGQKRPMPKNEGDTINFRRFNSLDVPAASLTEGVTPDGDNLSITAVTATVAQEGNWVRLSDKISMVGIDPVLTESAALMGENAAKTLETRCADVIFKGTSQQFAGGAASAAAIAAGKVVNSEEIKKAVRTLRNNNAEPLEGGYYIGFCDPSVAYDLQNDSLWQDVSKYSGAENIYSGEIGRLFGVVFVESTEAKVVRQAMLTKLVSHEAGSDTFTVAEMTDRAAETLMRLKKQFLVILHGSVIFVNSAII